MGLPILPMIPSAYLAPSKRPYSGAIKPGDVFAWEPDLPHARELLVVTRIVDETHRTLVWTRHIDGDEEVYNDIDRFREAVVPTILNPHSPFRTKAPIPWPFGK